MTSDPGIQKDILAAIPHLRAFAISLTGDVDRADDLVQEAIVRGLGNLDKFTPGTSMQAWLFTILRNLFHTAYRKSRREVEDLRTALVKLPVEQREAVLLVAGGISYEEAAQIRRVAIGTIKSRVNRARHG